MKSNTNELEQIYIQAMVMLEEGKSPQEVLVAFPQYAEKLHEMFLLLKVLKTDAGSVPSEHALRNILENIGVPVTNMTAERYKSRDGNIKGRQSLYTINTINQIYNRMTLNWKIIAPVGILALLAIMIGSGFKMPLNNQSQESTYQSQMTIPQVATGNVDDAINSLIAESSNDLSVFQNESDDISLINIDSQAISDFGQSYQ